MSHEDIKAMSDADLMDNWTALGEQVEADRERLRAYSAEYQDRCLVKQATDLMGAEALANLQGMAPVAVPSEESVAEPGIPNDGEEASDG